MTYNLPSSYFRILNLKVHFVLILILSLFILMACEADHIQVSLHNKPQFHEIEIIKVEQQIMPVIMTVPGKVVSKSQLKVASRLTGYIEQIHVDEGDIVKEDDVLVEIDNSQIVASIKAAGASVLAAKAELQDAEEDVKRFHKLVQSKIAAEDDLRNANVRRIGAKAKLATAEAELNSKRKEQRYAHIKSSVQAQVRERFFDSGDLATAGKVILLLDVLGDFEFEIYLPSSSMGSVTLDQTINVEIDSLPEPLEGKVSRIVHSLDDVTRSFKVSLSLPHHITLTPGQFGLANIVLRQQTATVTPDSAITRRAGIEGVFIKNKLNTLHFRSVRLGKSWGKFKEILSGLKAGDLVVNNPTSLLRDGDKAR